MENEIKKAGHELINAAKYFFMSIVLAFFEGYYIFFEFRFTESQDLAAIKFFSIVIAGLFLIGLIYLYKAGRSFYRINKVERKKNPFQGKVMYGVGVIIIIVALILPSHSERPVNLSNDFNSENRSNSYQKQKTDEPEYSTPNYSGTYYDYDQSTGWETTIVVSGNSFYGKTVAPTGDNIASSFGTLNGNSLIDEYGQNIGSVSGSSVSVKLGAVTIYCRKR